MYGNFNQILALITFFITISTFPTTNSTTRPHITIIKPTKKNSSLTSTPIAHLFNIYYTLSEATQTFIRLLNNAAISAIPLATLTALIKLGGLLKLQKPFGNGRHLQGQTVLKKTARTKSIYQGIPRL